MAHEQVPISSLDELGTLCPQGTLFLAQKKYRFDAINGITTTYEDLPWWLDDQCAQGFLGKRLLEYVHHQFPNIPAAEQPLRFPTQVGNLIINDYCTGFGSAQLTEFPDIAQHIFSNKNQSSSAGGEQPKFIANYQGQESIIKFSPPMHESIGRRWADLLIAEYHAQNTLFEAGLPATAPLLEIVENRAFLISPRMDRTQNGRRSLVSLDPVANQFTERSFHKNNWVEVARQLHEQQRLSLEDYQNIERLYTFGQCIDNTDMHLFNLGLRHELLNYGQFQLAPIYDMLPMRYSPQGYEALPLKTVPIVMDYPQFAEAMQALARQFWQKLVQEVRLSAPFRALAAERLDEK